MTDELIHTEGRLQLGLKDGVPGQVHLRAVMLPEPGVITGSPGSCSIILPRESALWLKDALADWLGETTDDRPRTTPDSGGRWSVVCGPCDEE